MLKQLLEQLKNATSLTERARILAEIKAYVMMTGPRGGKFYYAKSGRKIYRALSAKSKKKPVRIKDPAKQKKATSGGKDVGKPPAKSRPTSSAFKAASRAWSAISKAPYASDTRDQAKIAFIDEIRKVANAQPDWGAIAKDVPPEVVQTLKNIHASGEEAVKQYRDLQARTADQADAGVEIIRRAVDKANNILAKHKRETGAEISGGGHILDMNDAFERLKNLPKDEQMMYASGSVYDHPASQILHSLYGFVKYNPGIKRAVDKIIEPLERIEAGIAKDVGSVAKKFGSRFESELQASVRSTAEEGGGGVVPEESRLFSLQSAVLQKAVEVIAHQNTFLKGATTNGDYKAEIAKLEQWNNLYPQLVAAVYREGGN